MPRISQADLHALVQAQWEHEELGSGGDDGAGEFLLGRPGPRAAKIVRYAHTPCIKGRGVQAYRLILAVLGPGRTGNKSPVPVIAAALTRNV